MEEPISDTLIVEESESLLRIDKLLAAKFQTKSRTYFQYLIKNGFVLLNGNRIKKRIYPRPGDEIEVLFQLTPENIKLNILFEDEHVIAVNKPVGMVVHPAPGHRCSTFVNALLYHCRNG